MAFRGYREESRTDWGTHAEGGLTIEQINCGSLMRIADATEAMSKNYTALLDQVRYLERRVAEEQSEIKRLRRSNAALRGCLKRAKGGA